MNPLRKSQLSVTSAKNSTSTALRKICECPCFCPNPATVIRKERRKLLCWDCDTAWQEQWDLVNFF